MSHAELVVPANRKAIAVQKDTLYDHDELKSMSKPKFIEFYSLAENVN